MNLVELLNNYSKENHLKLLYKDFPPIQFELNRIVSQNWENEVWLQSNKVPYVAITNLIDSYDCLPERPDMAFTHLWKSINNVYTQIAKKEKLSIINSNIANNITLNSQQSKDLNELSDSLGITYLVKSINSVKNEAINGQITIKNLLEEYLKIIPIKALKFISNTVLKGYVIDRMNYSSLANSSSYYSFKKKYPNLYTPIIQSYGAAYLGIVNPTKNGTSVDLNITDDIKSREIPASLSTKLKVLLSSRSAQMKSSDKQTDYTLSLNNDEEYIDFIIRIILYSIRNNSVHGNLVSRLNSEFMNKESVETSLYIYFLGHFILSLGLYTDGSITLNDLNVNIQNLDVIKGIV